MAGIRALNAEKFILKGKKKSSDLLNLYIKSNSTAKMPINIPIEVKIVDQKYCFNCMALMHKVGNKKFRCPECGEEEDFDYTEDGINC